MEVTDTLEVDSVDQILNFWHGRVKNGLACRGVCKSKGILISTFLAVMGYSMLVRTLRGFTISDS